MKKQIGSVYIQDWMKFHPITKQSFSDNYYLGICKEVYQLFQNQDFEDLMVGQKSDNLKDFACFLTCYFEDIISKTGIWQTFTSSHFELYNKYLPFYKLDEYYPDEINPQDIQFLIWYFISSKFPNEYLSPLNKDLKEMSLELYEIFDREYETAPENLKLKAFLSIAESETNFLKIRNVIDWLFISSYLFHFNEYAFENEIKKILDSKDDNLIKNAEAIGNDLRDHIAINQTSNLLAYRGTEWMSRILGKKHALYNDIKSLDKRKTGYFLYKGEDEQSILLQHIATDRVLKVTKASIDVQPEFKIDKTILYINLIYWKDEWWFSGSYSSVKYSEKLVDSEKESAISKALFDNKGAELKVALEVEYNSFLKFNNNRPIAFFENESEIREFINHFVQFHNANIKNSEEKLSDSEITTNNLENGKEDFQDKPEQTNGIVFFDKESGFSFILGLADAIPDEENKTYNPKSDIDILDFFFSPNCKPSFVKYLIKNYPALIDKYQSKTGDYFLQDDIDFLLRFWKHEMIE